MHKDVPYSNTYNNENLETTLLANNRASEKSCSIVEQSAVFESGHSEECIRGDVKLRKSELEIGDTLWSHLSLNLHLYRRRLEGNIPKC